VPTLSAEQHRETAEASLRWVLDQVRYDDRGPWVPWSVTGEPATEPPWDRHHRNVDVGERLDLDIDSTSFASEWDEGWPAGAGGVVLGFSVVERDTVDALYAKLTAAGYEVRRRGRRAAARDRAGRPVVRSPGYSHPLATALRRHVLVLFLAPLRRCAVARAS
jgi:hypothetical protein